MGRSLDGGGAQASGGGLAEVAAGTAGGAPLGLGWAGPVLPPGAGRAEAGPLDAVLK